jgi:hypothetical protein
MGQIYKTRAKVQRLRSGFCMLTGQAHQKAFPVLLQSRPQLRIRFV